MEKEIQCDASVSYKWGNYTLERGCKKKAKYILKARMKHNGYMFTRRVCQHHKNQIDNQQKVDGWSAEVYQVENI